MGSEAKKSYELSYFIVPEIKDEEIVTHTQRIKNLITGEKGEISKEEPPYKRRLAYPIRHKKQGHFGFMHFALSPEKLKEITGKLALDTAILRHMVITVDKKQIAYMNKPAPKAMSVKQPAQADIDKTVFKKERTISQQEENKAEFAELDKKLEEILNK